MSRSPFLEVPTGVARSKWINQAAEAEDVELDSLPMPEPKALLGLDWPEGAEVPVAFRKAFRRTLAVLSRRDAERTRYGYTKETRRTDASTVATYALWYVTPRHVRAAHHWPTSERDLCRMMAVNTVHMRALLVEARFWRWIDRYDERESEARRTRNVDDLLYAKVMEQEELPAAKVNGKVFEVYYRREGKLAQREANKTLNVHVHASKEDTALLVERVTKALPYVQGGTDERAGDPNPDRPEVADRTPVESGPRLEVGPAGELREEARSGVGAGAPDRPEPRHDAARRRPAGGRRHSKLGQRPQGEDHRG